MADRRDKPAVRCAQVLHLWHGFCQVVEAETLIGQAGASPQSYSPFRQPAPYARNPHATFCGSRRWVTAVGDSVWVGAIPPGYPARVETYLQSNAP